MANSSGDLGESFITSRATKFGDRSAWKVDNYGNSIGYGHEASKPRRAATGSFLGRHASQLGGGIGSVIGKVGISSRRSETGAGRSERLTTRIRKVVDGIAEYKELQGEVLNFRVRSQLDCAVSSEDEEVVNRKDKLDDLLDIGAKKDGEEPKLRSEKQKAKGRKSRASINGMRASINETAEGVSRFVGRVFQPAQAGAHSGRAYNGGYADDDGPTLTTADILSGLDESTDAKRQLEMLGREVESGRKSVEWDRLRNSVAPDRNITTIGTSVAADIEEGRGAGARKSVFNTLQRVTMNVISGKRPFAGEENGFQNLDKPKTAAGRMAAQQRALGLVASEEDKKQIAATQKVLSDVEKGINEATREVEYDMFGNTVGYRIKEAQDVPDGFSPNGKWIGNTAAYIQGRYDGLAGQSAYKPTRRESDTRTSSDGGKRTGENLFVLFGKKEAGTSRVSTSQMLGGIPGVAASTDMRKIARKSVNEMGLGGMAGGMLNAAVGPGAAEYGAIPLAAYDDSDESDIEILGRGTTEHLEKKARKKLAKQQKVQEREAEKREAREAAMNERMRQEKDDQKARKSQAGFNRTSERTSEVNPQKTEGLIDVPALRRDSAVSRKSFVGVDTPKNAFFAEDIESDDGFGKKDGDESSSLLHSSDDDGERSLDENGNPKPRKRSTSSIISDGFDDRKRASTRVDSKTSSKDGRKSLEVDSRKSAMGGMVGMVEYGSLAAFEKDAKSRRSSGFRSGITMRLKQGSIYDDEEGRGATDWSEGVAEDINSKKNEDINSMHIVREAGAVPTRISVTDADESTGLGNLRKSGRVEDDDYFKSREKPYEQYVEMPRQKRQANFKTSVVTRTSVVSQPNVEASQQSTVATPSFPMRKSEARSSANRVTIITKPEFEPGQGIDKFGKTADQVAKAFLVEEITRVQEVIAQTGGKPQDLEEVIHEMFENDDLEEKLDELLDKDETKQELLEKVQFAEISGFGKGASSWIFLCPKTRAQQREDDEKQAGSNLGAVSSKLKKSPERQRGKHQNVHTRQEEAEANAKVELIRDPSIIQQYETLRNSMLLDLPFNKKYFNLDTLDRVEAEIGLTEQKSAWMNEEDRKKMKKQMLALKFDMAFTSDGIPEFKDIYPQNIREGFAFDVLKSFIMVELARLNDLYNGLVNDTEHDAKIPIAGLDGGRVKVDVTLEEKEFGMGKFGIPDIINCVEQDRKIHVEVDEDSGRRIVIGADMVDLDTLVAGVKKVVTVFKKMLGNQAPTLDGDDDEPEDLGATAGTVCRRERKTQKVTSVLDTLPGNGKKALTGDVEFCELLADSLARFDLDSRKNARHMRNMKLKDLVEENVGGGKDVMEKLMITAARASKAVNQGSQGLGPNGIKGPIKPIETDMNGIALPQSSPTSGLAAPSPRQGRTRRASLVAVRSDSDVGATSGLPGLGSGDLAALQAQAEGKGGEGRKAPSAMDAILSGLAEGHGVQSPTNKSRGSNKLGGGGNKSLNKRGLRRQESVKDLAVKSTFYRQKSGSYLDEAMDVSDGLLAKYEAKARAKGRWIPPREEALGDFLPPDKEDDYDALAKTAVKVLKEKATFEQQMREEYAKRSQASTSLAESMNSSGRSLGFGSLAGRFFSRTDSESHQALNYSAKSKAKPKKLWKKVQGSVQRAVTFRKDDDDRPTNSEGEHSSPRSRPRSRESRPRSRDSRPRTRERNPFLDSVFMNSSFAKRMKRSRENSPRGRGDKNNYAVDLGDILEGLSPQEIFEGLSLRDMAEIISSFRDLTNDQEQPPPPPVVREARFRFPPPKRDPKYCPSIPPTTFTDDGDISPTNREFCPAASSQRFRPGSRQTASRGSAEGVSVGGGSDGMGHNVESTGSGGGSRSASRMESLSRPTTRNLHSRELVSRQSQSREAFPSRLPSRGESFPTRLPSRGESFSTRLPSRGEFFPSRLPSRGESFPTCLPSRGDSFPTRLPSRGEAFPRGLTTASEDTRPMAQEGMRPVTEEGMRPTSGVRPRTRESACPTIKEEKFIAGEGPLRTSDNLRPTTSEGTMTGEGTMRPITGESMRPGTREDARPGTSDSSVCEGSSPIGRPLFEHGRPISREVRRPGSRECARRGSRETTRPGSREMIRPGSREITQIVRPVSREMTRPGSREFQVAREMIGGWDDPPDFLPLAPISEDPEAESEIQSLASSRETIVQKNSRKPIQNIIDTEVDTKATTVEATMESENFENLQRTSDDGPLGNTIESLKDGEHSKNFHKEGFSPKQYHLQEPFLEGEHNKIKKKRRMKKRSSINASGVSGKSKSSNKRSRSRSSRSVTNSDSDVSSDFQCLASGQVYCEGSKYDPKKNKKLKGKKGGTSTSAKGGKPGDTSKSPKDGKSPPKVAGKKKGGIRFDDLSSVSTDEDVRLDRDFKSALHSFKDPIKGKYALNRFDPEQLELKNKDAEKAARAAAQGDIRAELIEEKKQADLDARVRTVEEREKMLAVEENEQWMQRYGKDKTRGQKRHYVKGEIKGVKKQHASRMRELQRRGSAIVSGALYNFIYGKTKKVELPPDDHDDEWIRDSLFLIKRTSSIRGMTSTQLSERKHKMKKQLLFSPIKKERDSATGFDGAAGDGGGSDDEKDDMSYVPKKFQQSGVKRVATDAATKKALFDALKRGSVDSEGKPIDRAEAASREGGDGEGERRLTIGEFEFEDNEVDGIRKMSERKSERKSARRTGTGSTDADGKKRTKFADTNDSLEYQDDRATDSEDERGSDDKKTDSEDEIDIDDERDAKKKAIQKQSFFRRILGIVKISRSKKEYHKEDLSKADGETSREGNGEKGDAKDDDDSGEGKSKSDGKSVSINALDETEKQSTMTKEQGSKLQQSVKKTISIRRMVFGRNLPKTVSDTSDAAAGDTGEVDVALRGAASGELAMSKTQSLFGKVIIMKSKVRAVFKDATNVKKQISNVKRTFCLGTDDEEAGGGGSSGRSFLRKTLSRTASVLQKTLLLSGGQLFLNRDQEVRESGKRLKHLKMYASLPLPLAESLNNIYLKFDGGEKVRRSVCTNYPIPNQRFLCFECQCFNMTFKSLVNIGFCLKPHLSTSLPGEYPVSIAYSSQGFIIKTIESKLEGAKKDKDSKKKEELKQGETQWARGLRGFDNFDIITCLIDRERGLFNFYVNRAPVFGKFQYFKPLQLKYHRDCYVSIGSKGTSVIRCDFGGYGYSCMTNAVLYKEEKLRSVGMHWRTVVFGGYVNDREHIDEDLAKEKHFEARRALRAKKETPNADGTNISKDYAHQLKEKKKEEKKAEAKAEDTEKKQLVDSALTELWKQQLDDEICRLEMEGIINKSTPLERMKESQSKFSKLELIKHDKEKKEKEKLYKRLRGATVDEAMSRQEVLMKLAGVSYRTATGLLDDIRTLHLRRQGFENLVNTYLDQGLMDQGVETVEELYDFEVARFPVYKDALRCRIRGCTCPGPPQFSELDDGENENGRMGMVCILCNHLFCRHLPKLESIRPWTQSVSMNHRRNQVEPYEFLDGQASKKLKWRPFSVGGPITRPLGFQKDKSQMLSPSSPIDMKLRHLNQNQADGVNPDDQVDHISIPTSLTSKDQNSKGQPRRGMMQTSGDIYRSARSAGGGVVGGDENDDGRMLWRVSEGESCGFGDDSHREWVAKWFEKNYPSYYGAKERLKERLAKEALEMVAERHRLLAESDKAQALRQLSKKPILVFTGMKEITDVEQKLAKQTQEMNEAIASKIGEDNASIAQMGASNAVTNGVESGVAGVALHMRPKTISTDHSDDEAGGPSMNKLRRNMMIKLQQKGGLPSSKTQGGSIGQPVPEFDLGAGIGLLNAGELGIDETVMRLRNKRPSTTQIGYYDVKMKQVIWEDDDYNPKDKKITSRPASTNTYLGKKREKWLDAESNKSQSQRNREEYHREEWKRALSRAALKEKRRRGLTKAHAIGSIKAAGRERQLREQEEMLFAGGWDDYLNFGDMQAEDLIETADRILDELRLDSEKEGFFISTEMGGKGQRSMRFLKNKESYKWFKGGEQYYDPLLKSKAFLSGKIKIPDTTLVDEFEQEKDGKDEQEKNDEVEKKEDSDDLNIDFDYKLPSSSSSVSEEPPKKIERKDSVESAIDSNISKSEIEPPPLAVTRDEGIYPGKYSPGCILPWNPYDGEIFEKYVGPGWYIAGEKYKQVEPDSPLRIGTPGSLAFEFPVFYHLNNRGARKAIVLRRLMGYDDEDNDSVFSNSDELIPSDRQKIQSERKKKESKDKLKGKKIKKKGKKPSKGASDNDEKHSGNPSRKSSRESFKKSSRNSRKSMHGEDDDQPNSRPSSRQSRTSKTDSKISSESSSKIPKSERHRSSRRPSDASSVTSNDKSETSSSSESSESYNNINHGIIPFTGRKRLATKNLAGFMISKGINQGMGGIKSKAVRGGRGATNKSLVVFRMSMSPHSNLRAATSKKKRLRFGVGMMQEAKSEEEVDTPTTGFKAMQEESMVPPQTAPADTRRWDRFATSVMDPRMTGAAILAKRGTDAPVSEKVRKSAGESLVQEDLKSAYKLSRLSSHIPETPEKNTMLKKGLSRALSRGLSRDTMSGGLSFSIDAEDDERVSIISPGGSSICFGRQSTRGGSLPEGDKRTSTINPTSGRASLFGDIIAEDDEEDDGIAMTPYMRAASPYSTKVERIRLAVKGKVLEELHRSRFIPELMKASLFTQQRLDDIAESTMTEYKRLARLGENATARDIDAEYDETVEVVMETVLVDILDASSPLVDERFSSEEPAEGAGEDGAALLAESAASLLDGAAPAKKKTMKSAKMVAMKEEAQQVGYIVDYKTGERLLDLEDNYVKATYDRRMNIWLGTKKQIIPIFDPNVAAARAEKANRKSLKAIRKSVRQSEALPETPGGEDETPDRYGIREDIKELAMADRLLAGRGITSDDEDSDGDDDNEEEDHDFIVPALTGMGLAEILKKRTAERGLKFQSMSVSPTNGSIFASMQVGSPSSGRFASPNANFNPNLNMSMIGAAGRTSNASVAITDASASDADTTPNPGTTPSNAMDQSLSKSLNKSLTTRGNLSRKDTIERDADVLNSSRRSRETKISFQIPVDDEEPTEGGLESLSSKKGGLAGSSEKRETFTIEGTSLDPEFQNLFGGGGAIDVSFENSKDAQLVGAQPDGVDRSKTVEFSEHSEHDQEDENLEDDSLRGQIERRMSRSSTLTSMRQSLIRGKTIDLDFANLNPAAAGVLKILHATKDKKRENATTNLKRRTTVRRTTVRGDMRRSRTLADVNSVADVNSEAIGCTERESILEDKTNADVEDEFRKDMESR